MKAFLNCESYIVSLVESQNKVIELEMSTIGPPLILLSSFESRSTECASLTTKDHGFFKAFINCSIGLVKVNSFISTLQ